MNKKYTICFIDGHDMKYKERTVEAADMAEGFAKLKESYNGDFDHQYIEILEDGRQIWKK